jgi:RNA polymerase sigma-70 factor (ECF subfamily)
VADEELARLSQAGSLSAFEELVRRYEAKVYHFIRSWRRHDEDARDLTQAAFVTAFRKLARYDARRPFAPWLFTIARRKLTDHVRSARRELASETPDAPDTVDERDPATLMQDRETRERIWDLARRVLPKKLFESLWLRYQEEMSVRDIATVLRRGQARVKVDLFRARARLAKVLRPYWTESRPRPNCSEAPIPSTAESIR